MVYNLDIQGTTVKFLIYAFLIESVALCSKCLLIVIQISRLYIWRWTPGSAQVHGLSEGCRPGPGTRPGPGLGPGPGQPPLRPWAWAEPGVHRQIYKREIWITIKGHFEESAADSIKNEKIKNLTVQISLGRARAKCSETHGGRCQTMCEQ